MRKGPDGPKLSNESWWAFLSPFTCEELVLGTQAFQHRINGYTLTLTESRTFNRWRHGAAPGFYIAEEFCQKVGLHIDHYFDWCEHEGLPAWNSHGEWSLRARRALVF